MTRRIPAHPRWLPLLLLVLVALVLSACAGGGLGPGASGASPTPSPVPTPLIPAQPGADPLSFLAWLFTPIFQAMFIILVAFYDLFTYIGLPAAIGWAIVMLTLIVRALVIPLVRKQLVSQRRMQLLQPEMKEIQRRYKGDAMKTREAQQALYKERGINPLAGCFPLLLQMPLLFIMYSVISHGLTSVDPTAMVSVFGHQVVPLTCVNPPGGPPDAALGACINTIIPLPWGATINVGLPSTIFAVAGFGISILAIFSALLQLVQSRDDAAGRVRRRRPEHQDPAADDAAPAAHLDRVRRLPARRPVHLLDHRDDLRDRPAVPDRRLGRDVPDVRLDARVRDGPHPAIPGGAAPPPEPGKRSAILTDADKKTTADKTIRPRERAVRADEGDDADMSAYKEFSGKTVEEALRLAREEFGVGLEDLDFEILTPGSRGVLGMGAEPARIVAAPRPPSVACRAQAEAAAAVPLPPAPPGTATATTARRADDAIADRGPRRDDRRPSRRRCPAQRRAAPQQRRRPARWRRCTVPNDDDARQADDPPRRDDRPPRRDDRPPRRDDRPPRRDEPAGGLTASEAAEVAAARGSLAAERADLEAAEASPEALAAGKAILEHLMTHLGFDVKARGRRRRDQPAQRRRRRRRARGARRADRAQGRATLGAPAPRQPDALQGDGRPGRGSSSTSRTIAAGASASSATSPSGPAARVVETGKMLQLEPMPALERRWIHLTLRDHPDVAHAVDRRGAEPTGRHRAEGRRLTRALVQPER